MYVCIQTAWERERERGGEGGGGGGRGEFTINFTHVQEDTLKEQNIFFNHFYSSKQVT